MINLLLFNNSSNFNDILYILNKEINTIHSRIMENKEIKKYECRVYLFCLYILCEMSCKEIGKECGISVSAIYRWLKKFNIKRIKKKKSGKNAYWYGKYGDENPNWQENWEKLILIQKHRRIRKMLEKIGIFPPDYCPICNKPKGKNNLDLMNIDHQYKENTLDYYYICSKCHNIYHSLVDLGGKTSGITIKPIPNLINNLLQLQTREEREKLLKEVILKNECESR